jgi:putative RNA 2'-phosphotransferase
MDRKQRTEVSKFRSYHLRHAPEGLGLTLEAGGWVAVADLLGGCARAGRPLSRQDLDEVVATSEKKRFSFDDTGTRIRANQGHSVEVDLELKPVTPPAVLYHGTTARFLAAIQAGGLQRMARHHVHLSPTVEAARVVGARRGPPVVLAIDAAALAADGAVFYCSENGVWLVDEVPPRYLRVV